MHPRQALRSPDFREKGGGAGMFEVLFSGSDGSKVRGPPHFLRTMFVVLAALSPVLESDFGCEAAFKVPHTCMSIIIEAKMWRLEIPIPAP